MARRRNEVDTVQITLSTTPLMREYLKSLVAQGLFGKNVADAAERLVADKIKELRAGNDDVATELNQTWRRVQEEEKVAPESPD